MFGFGGRSPALGGTGVADPSGYDSSYLNPAGFAHLHGKQLNVGMLFGDFTLKGLNRPVEDAVGVEVGLAVPMPLRGWLKDRVGFGVGVYMPTDVVNRVRAPQPGVPYYTLLESRAQTIGINVGVGLKVSSAWSIGVGIMSMGALKGTLDIRRDPAGRPSAITEAGLVTDIAPLVGIHYKQNNSLRFGITTRTESAASYDIDVETSLGDDVPLVLPTITLAGIAQYVPLTVATELAWRPAPSLQIAGQIAWERWSAFPIPSEDPIAIAPRGVSPDFRDTVVPRVGIEWAPKLGDSTTAALRIGYAFAMTPAKQATPMRAFVDNNRHVATGGLGVSALKAPVPFTIDAWFQFHGLPARHHQLGTRSLRSSGWILVGGLVLGVELK